MMIFKVTIKDEKGEIIAFEMPENSEFVFQIEDKNVIINNSVK